MKLLLLTLHASLLFSSACFAQGKTLEDILTFAKQDTPKQKLIKENHTVQKSEARLLLSQVMPQVDFTWNALRMTQSTDTPNFKDNPNLGNRIGSQVSDWSIQARGPLYSFGRSIYLYKSFKKQLKLIEIEKIASEEQYLLMVVYAYNNALLSAGFAQEAEDSHKYLLKLLQFTEIEYQRGALSQIDKLNAESNKAKSEAQFYKAAQESKSAMSQLMFLLGKDTQNPFTLDDTMNETSSFFNIPRQSQTEGFNSTELKIAKASKEVAENLSSYYRNKFLPGVGYFLSLSSDMNKTPDLGINENYGDLINGSRIKYQMGVSLTWNIFSGYATTAEMHKYQSLQNSASIRLQEAQEEQKIKIQEAFNSLETARKIFIAQKKTRQAAELYFQELDRDFRQGAASLPNLLEAQRDLSSAKQAIFSSYVNMIKATAELKTLIGVAIFP